MEFIIKQELNRISVYKNDILFLYVSTKENWLGRFTSNFYLKDILILTSSNNMIAIWIFLKIHYQNINAELSLYNKKLLKINDDFYSCNFNYFKNKDCVIKKNGIPVASLYIKKDLKWLSVTPNQLVYHFSVNENENELFCLIRLLISFTHLHN